jgi:methionyl-tRNA formyltransferase
MRIVFIGMVEFSLRALEKLLAMRADVVGVCTRHRSDVNADHVDLSGLCAARGIPSHDACDVNAFETVEWIRAKAPDVIFCFGWSSLLKADLLALAPLGVVGFHPAALPANRGRHPIIWALVLGLEHTASTFFFMDAGADSGDIISQRAVEIARVDDARTLYDKITEIALRQIEDFVPRLGTPGLERRPQDAAHANTWRKRTVDDGRIDWRMSATAIHNLVRGLAKPYAGASFLFRGQEITVWKSEVIRAGQRNVEPGRVIRIDELGEPVIKCGEDAVRLVVTEPRFMPGMGEAL